MTEPKRSNESPPAPTSGETLKIRIRGLMKSFGPKRVLDGVDLDIQKAESLVIIGGSGTGKSVLLKHIIGLLKPDAGTVEIDGVAMESLSNRELTEFRRRFGMSFQEGALFDSMTVGENVGFPLTRQTQMTAAERRDRVEECLELVRLSGVADKVPSQLSGGMRRRVGFARAIAVEPEILLFDEPTSALDPIATGKIEDLIDELRKKVTIIIVTHNMQQAARVSDRTAFMLAGDDRIGRLVEYGETRLLFTNPRDRRTEDYITGRFG